jgi:hypothetical protein
MIEQDQQIVRQGVHQTARARTEFQNQLTLELTPTEA